MRSLGSLTRKTARCLPRGGSKAIFAWPRSLGRYDWIDLVLGVVEGRRGVAGGAIEELVILELTWVYRGGSRLQECR